MKKIKYIDKVRLKHIKYLFNLNIQISNKYHIFFKNYCSKMLKKDKNIKIDINYIDIYRYKNRY